MNWLAFATYVVVNWFTPGPNNIMAMTNGSRLGLRKSLNFNFGVMTGFFVIMLLGCYLSLGISTLLPRFRLIMSVVGAAYMLYLAAKLALSGQGAHVVGSATPSSFWAGAGLQFVNAKGILCMLTAIGTFMLPYSRSHAFLLIGSLVLAFAAFVSNTCWTLFGVTFQRLLARYWRPFHIVMALLLLYCAVSLFL